MEYIRCFSDPVNITHLSNEIYVPRELVFDYCKELYEKGLGRKSIPPQRDYELQEFFLWKARYRSTNIVFRKIIDALMFI